MQKYIIQRLILTIPTVIGVTLLTFIGLRVALPGDVIDLILEEFGQNDPALRAQLEEELGLSANIPTQYLEWMGISYLYRGFSGPEGVLQGNLGESLHSGRTVTSEVKRRVPVSFELGVWAQLTAIAASVPMGVWAALRQDKLPDYGLRTLAIVLNAVPSFWIAVLLIHLRLDLVQLGATDQIRVPPR